MDPRTRAAVLGFMLAFVVLLGVLTVKVAATNGIDVLVVVSLLVLALFGVGIAGALRNPPEE